MRGLSKAVSITLAAPVLAALSLAATSKGAATAQAATAPPWATCDQAGSPQPGWSSGALPADSARHHRFWLSDCYPAAASPDAQPWLAFDPKTQPEQYLWAVLDYFYEGNIRDGDADASFDPRQNPVRGWYNAPWLDYSPNGREGLHGLTRERTSCRTELGPRQQRIWDNYAVGFYNAPGAVTLGKVWRGHGDPVSASAAMPEGTVAAKLLFTTATEAEAPYLKGSPKWPAYIYANTHDRDFFAPEHARRVVREVRLLQVDIAVRDSRVNASTGWVFGTFVYGGGPGVRPNTDAGWSNLTPVGLMWGNNNGEQWINTAQHTHLGRAGRLDGPVDNPKSSCLSCHSTAEVFPVGGPPPPGLIPGPHDRWQNWFNDLPADTAFRPGGASLDYSLQLAVGIGNYKDFQDGQVPQLPPFCDPSGFAL